MALPQWPSELPHILIAGYSDHRIDDRMWPNRERGGAPRLMSSANLREMSVNIAMYNWQRARLERFWIRETSCGAKTFIIADPIRHRIPVLVSNGSPALMHDGKQILLSCWRRARFGQGGISWSLVGVKPIASFTLVIYDR